MPACFNRFAGRPEAATVISKILAMEVATAPSYVTLFQKTMLSATIRA